MNVKFMKKLKDMKNPYRNGNASEKIIKKIKETQINKDLIIKKFNNLSC